MKFVINLVMIILFIFIKTPCYAGCFMVAAYQFNLDPRLIYAVAKNESNLKADITHINDNGTYDIGLMQINSIHLVTLNKKGIKKEELFNECKNIMIGSWLLRKSVDDANGDIWKGVSYYHSRNVKYGRPYMKKIQMIYRGIGSEDLKKVRER